MNEPASAPPFLYVDTGPRLRDLLRRLEGAQAVALDTEADSLHHYFEKVCLIQLTAGQEHAIVDPLCGLDLSPLMDVLARRTLVLHGADYDLRMLRMTFGFRPQGEVFDTMLAARLLGHEALGLAALAERLLGVGMSKGGQKSDWSRRPLSPAQLRYAADDTRYLLPLAERLREDLARLGRIPWLRESCSVMVRHAAQEREKDPDEVWRIKGASRLGREQLNVLRSLFYWRDREARQADHPSFRILGNQQLLELAARAVSDPEGALGGSGGFELPRNCTGRRLQALKEALREAAAKPQNEWPDLRRHEPPPRKVPAGLLADLRAEAGRLARETGLDSTTLATRSALENIARTRPDGREAIAECGPLMEWQARLLEPGVQRILKRRS